MNDNGSQLLEAIVTNAAKRQPASRKLDQFAIAGRIANHAYDLTEKDRILSLEFLAGTDFKSAAGSAFDLLLLSKMPTRFRFNGVEVSLTRAED